MPLPPPPPLPTPKLTHGIPMPAGVKGRFRVCSGAARQCAFSQSPLPDGRVHSTFPKNLSKSATHLCLPHLHPPSYSSFVSSAKAEFLQSFCGLLTVFHCPWVSFASHDLSSTAQRWGLQRLDYGAGSGADSGVSCFWSKSHAWETFTSRLGRSSLSKT